MKEIIQHFLGEVISLKEKTLNNLLKFKIMSNNGIIKIGKLYF